MLKYEIEGGHLPVVICYPEVGQTLCCEGGSMSWMSPNMQMETTSGGGAKKVFGRLFSGESLFMSHYTAQGPAEIAFTSSFPGRIVARELKAGQSVICQKSAFLCATEGVELSAYVQKKVGAGLVGGEGFIMQKVTGPGMAFFEFDGYCPEYDLAAGEELVCDTGVLAMMDETCTMDVRMVKGAKNLLLGGEGLVDTVITGPGKVYLQTMTVAGLAKLIIPFVPEKK